MNDLNPRLLLDLSNRIEEGEDLDEVVRQAIAGVKGAWKGAGEEIAKKKQRIRQKRKTARAMRVLGKKKWKTMSPRAQQQYLSKMRNTFEVSPEADTGPTQLVRGVYQRTKGAIKGGVKGVMQQRAAEKSAAAMKGQAAEAEKKAKAEKEAQQVPAAPLATTTPEPTVAKSKSAPEREKGPDYQLAMAFLKTPDLTNIQAMATNAKSKKLKQIAQSMQQGYQQILGAVNKKRFPEQYREKQATPAATGLVGPGVPVKESLHQAVILRRAKQVIVEGKKQIETMLPELLIESNGSLLLTLMERTMPRLTMAVYRAQERLLKALPDDPYVTEAVGILIQEAQQGDLSSVYLHLQDMEQHITQQLHWGLEGEATADTIHRYRRAKKIVEEFEGFVTRTIMSRRQALAGPDAPEDLMGQAIFEIESWVQEELNFGERDALPIGEVFSTFGHIFEKKTIREAIDELVKQGKIQKSGRYLRVPGGTELDYSMRGGPEGEIPILPSGTSPSVEEY